MCTDIKVNGKQLKYKAADVENGLCAVSVLYLSTVSFKTAVYQKYLNKLAIHNISFGSSHVGKLTCRTAQRAD